MLRSHPCADRRHSAADQHAVQPAAARGVPRASSHVIDAERRAGDRARDRRELGPEASPRSGAGDRRPEAPTATRSPPTRIDASIWHLHFNQIEERIDRLEKTVARPSTCCIACCIRTRRRPPSRRSPTPSADERRAADRRGRSCCVVGARPNYMKMAPLVRAFAARPDLPRRVLVHTGQHYDVAMNERLFADLEMPRARPQSRGRLGHACGADGRDHAALRACARPARAELA